jgi:UTP--glucose-1-phosphate uridylyltransferase
LKIILIREGGKVKIRKAVIPAAGFGTRFLPATKASPKEMLPVVDKPVIQYIVEEAAQSGIEEVIIITGSNKRSIEDHFDYNFELEYRLKQAGKHELCEEIRKISDMVKIVYVRQKEQLGNGHAVLQAKEIVGDEPFAVMWGDEFVDSKTPWLKQLIEVYEKYRASVIAAMKVDDEATKQYGIIEGKSIEPKVTLVSRLIEKPGPEAVKSRLASVGRYILHPAIFEILPHTPPHKDGEIYLPDAINILAQKQAVYAYEFEGIRFDTGNKLGFLKATVHFGLKHNDLREPFKEYLVKKISNSNYNKN